MASKKDAPKVPVTMKALIARLNRKLAQEDEKLVASRGERARNELGNYYVINVSRNVILFKDVSPETLATQYGVLKPYERIVEE